MSGAIMLDLDGVTYPFSTAFKEWAELQEGRELEIITNWHFYREWGWHDEKFVKELRKFASDGGFAFEGPLPGSTELVRNLVRWGFEVHIITDRPEEARADTAWWVETFLPDYTSLTISRDKTLITKMTDGPFFALDDRVENVDTMRAAGIEAVLMDRPWNQHGTGLRVKTLEEFGTWAASVRLQYAV